MEPNYLFFAVLSIIIWIVIVPTIQWAHDSFTVLQKFITLILTILPANYLCHHYYYYQELVCFHTNSKLDAIVESNFLLIQQVTLWCLTLWLVSKIWNISSVSSSTNFMLKFAVALISILQLSLYLVYILIKKRLPSLIKLTKTNIPFIVTIALVVANLLIIQES